MHMSSQIYCRLSPYTLLENISLAEQVCETVVQMSLQNLLQLIKKTVYFDRYLRLINLPFLTGHSHFAFLFLLNHNLISK